MCLDGGQIAVFNEVRFRRLREQLERHDRRLVQYRPSARRVFDQVARMTAAQLEVTSAKVARERLRDARFVRMSFSRQ